MPRLLLVISSFTDSKLVTVRGGCSTRGYSARLYDQPLRDAAWVTLRVAFISACVATVMGTLAAVTLVRFGWRSSRGPPL